MTIEVEPDLRRTEVPNDKQSLSTNKLNLGALLSLDLSSSWLDKFGLRESSIRELIHKSRESVFSMGIGDVAAQIGEAVSQLFVAKMFYVQERLGLAPFAEVTQPPDATIQTYYLKFIRSVPETARIVWGKPDAIEFIPGEIDIDFCGMVTVGLSKPITPAQLAQNIITMKHRLQVLDGVKLDTNCIQPGNHFANIYRVRDYDCFGLPPFIGVIHMASDEYRDPLREVGQ